ncbi:MAG: helix-turn-helix domain-containing protein, partial [Thiotrichaceae bacterium]|nr:helix-turn-helix domain-containing protein [Thiotrichaceae bacterium]
ISAIHVLMEQHNLTATDLQDEIGSKSLVSMILNGKRSLTREHITKLSRRFNISPAIFFDLRVVS